MEKQLKRCFIRGWKPSDVDSLAFHANEKAISNNLRDSFPFPYTKTDAENFIKNIVPTNPYLLAIVIEGKAVGGFGGIIQTDIHQYTIEIGYWLGKNYWGRGIMTEVVLHFSDWLISDKGFHRVYALPFSSNAASISLLKKVGFQFEGTLRKSAFKNGKDLDQSFYAKTSISSSQ